MKIINFVNKNRFSASSLVVVIIWHALLLANNRTVVLPLFLIGMFLCTLLPGLVTVIALGAKKLTAQTLLIAIGLSFAFMLIVGASANYVPLLFGATKPLNLQSVLASYDIWLLLIFFWALNVNNGLPKIRLPKVIFNLRSALVYSVVIGGLTLSIFGTYRLNNGLDNFLSIIGFGLLISAVLLVFIWRRSLPLHVYLFAIIGLSSGLLLVTSLRSNFISGQDLKQEFRVYNITSNAGYWSMANFRDSYNACLSITLYPFTLVKLLGVGPETIFKYVYQLIFATCPLAVFLMLKLKFGKNLALVGTVFFLSLPTVGIDLPLQTRQQIAFMLFSLVILVWFNHGTEQWIKRHWHALLIIFSFAIIVSHYSTAYIYVGTLLLYYLLRTLLLSTRNAKRKDLNQSFLLPGRIIFLIFLFAFFWLGQVTAVSANLVEKLQPALSAFIAGGKNDSSSENTITPINGQTNPLYGYILRTKSEGTQVSQETYREVLPINDTLDVAPPLRSLPILMQDILKLISQKIYYVVGITIYPLLIGLGLLSLLFRNKRLKHTFVQKPEYIVLSSAMLIVLVVQTILPGIAADYGITRALIQAFIILCVPFMAGIAELINISKFKQTANTIVVLGSIMLFCTYSGLVGQLTGGLRPQLNFNNNGPYYGAFYVRRNDIKAYEWIESNIASPGNVSSPDYSFPTALAYIPEYRHYGGGIFPFQENSGNYILFNYTQTQSDITYTTGNVLAVKLNQQNFKQKNTIYSSNLSRILK